MSSTPVAIVLAAGRGTRMKSDLPKVLLPVCGRPMIHFVLDALSAAGIQDKVVVVGHRSELVVQELAGRKDHVDTVLQSQQLGTGHAVMQCIDSIRGRSGPVVVVAGDSPLLQPSSMKRLLAEYSVRRPSLLLGTLIKDDPTGLGRILRNEVGEFVGIVEHRDATDPQRAIREVNMSTYLFDTGDLVQALGQIGNANQQKEYYLTDCAAVLRDLGRSVIALPVLQPCEALSINDPAELELVDRTMRSMGYSVVTA